MTNTNPWPWLAGSASVGLAIAIAAGYIWRSPKEPLQSPVDSRAISSLSTDFRPPRKELPADHATRAGIAARSSEKNSLEENAAQPAVRDPELAWRMKIFAWTEDQPQAALAWASSLSDPAQRQMAVSAVCAKLAEKDPALAASEAARLLPPEDHLLPDLVQQWAAKDVQMALTWVQNQTNQPQKDEMLARVAFEWSRIDPAEAARLVVEKIAPGTTQEETAISVLHQWTRRDLASAKTWVELFPEGALKERARNEVAGASASAASP